MSVIRYQTSDGAFECIDLPIVRVYTRVGWRLDAPEDAMVVLTIEHEHEDDGRWLAEVLELPGVLAYGQTQQEATARVEALALRVLADRLEHQQVGPPLLSVSLATA